VGRNNSDFHEGKALPSFGDIWTANEPNARFAVEHPEKPGEVLINPTGQLNPEHWIPMALDMERKQAALKEDEDEDED
jgi:hypothetical protein